MDEHTKYTDKWTMQEAAPYLLKYHFGNRPTSNKDLSEAFWKLMGKNLELSGMLRWTTGKKGVPYHIHRLVGNKILAEVAPENQSVQDLSYPEYIHSYVLGPAGESMIESFEKKYGAEKIAHEVRAFLAEQPETDS